MLLTDLPVAVSMKTYECGLLVQKPMQKLWDTVKAKPPKTSGGSAYTFEHELSGTISLCHCRFMEYPPAEVG
jgi:hypothetical protein